MKKLTVSLLITTLLAIGAVAQTTQAPRPPRMSHPLQLSATPQIAIYGPDELIEGLVLNLWGENPQRALAIGFVNGSRDDSSGVSLGILMNYANNYTGLHIAPINYASGEFAGLQWGIANYAVRARGLQWGLLNYANSMHGVQIGALNYVDQGDAVLQIGLINIIQANTVWFANLPNEVAPGMILVNWRF